MNKQLEQANKYAELCDVAYVAWKKRQNFTNTKIEFGDDCKVLEGRKYYEVIRGRKGACCHMGYVCKQTGKLYKEQRQNGICLIQMTLIYYLLTFAHLEAIYTTHTLQK